MTLEQSAALATTPTEELLALPMLQADQVKDSLHAYQIAKEEILFGSWQKRCGGAGVALG